MKVRLAGRVDDRVVDSLATVSQSRRVFNSVRAARLTLLFFIFIYLCIPARIVLCAVQLISQYEL